MGKKNAFVTTIGFNKNDPAHVQVAEILNGMERGKAQYIVNAVLAYQNGGGGAGSSPPVQTLDYEKIRSFVLQVIEEHEQQVGQVGGVERRMENMSVPEPPDGTGEDGRMPGDGMPGFDEDALSGILSSLEAFKG